MSSRLVCEAPEREDSFVLRAGVFPRLSLVSLSSSRGFEHTPFYSVNHFSTSTAQTSLNL